MLPHVVRVGSAVQIADVPRIAAAAIARRRGERRAGDPPRPLGLLLLTTAFRQKAGDGGWASQAMPRQQGRRQDEQQCSRDSSPSPAVTLRWLPRTRHMQPAAAASSDGRPVRPSGDESGAEHSCRVSGGGCRAFHARPIPRLDESSRAGRLHVTMSVSAHTGACRGEGHRKKLVHGRPSLGGHGAALLAHLCRRAVLRRRGSTAERAGPRRRAG